MSASLAILGEPFNFNWLEQMNVVNGAVGRLIVAALLGGLVGLEHELSRMASGLRTNLLICVGSAFFTLLSPILAGDTGTNRGQVASNIVQRIGFLGAGLILHNRNRVSGLTSAASVWVVASIGMACGAGLYAPAVIGTLIVIAALLIVGFFEQKVNLKIYTMIYEARGHDQTAMLESTLSAMDQARERLTDLEKDAFGVLQRICFSLTATSRRHQRIHANLQVQPSIETLLTFHDPEED